MTSLVGVLVTGSVLFWAVLVMPGVINRPEWQELESMVQFICVYGPAGSSQTFTSSSCWGFS